MESRPRPARLLERLDAIGRSLAASGHALALIGLGSVGEERDRLDGYSDLDFFAIVQPGFKPDYIDDLAWLARTYPIAFSFPNTVDGHKVLFDDGVYAEFAVFEPGELAAISMRGGRIIWQDGSFDGDAALLDSPPPPAPPPPSVEWLAGEILTNVYVGLTRYHCGERLSAMRLIQTHAVDRLIELSAHIERSAAASADPFALERRYEARYPQTGAHLPDFAQGYDRSVESAQAILAFLEAHVAVNAALKRRILNLCASASANDAP